MGSELLLTRFYCQHEVFPHEPNFHACHAIQYLQFVHPFQKYLHEHHMRLLSFFVSGITTNILSTSFTTYLYIFQIMLFFKRSLWKMYNIVIFDNIILMATLSNGYLAEILCLVSQILATGYTTIKLYDNRNEFPVRQQSPIITIGASVCFMLANIVSFVGRLIVNASSDIEVPCKTSEIGVLFLLGILFSFLREIPLIFFCFKTLRVSLCFWSPFNQKPVQKISKGIIRLFSSQRLIILTSLFYIVLMNLIILLPIWTTEDKQMQAYLPFEFFCPKKINPCDWIMTFVRFLLFCLAYASCIWTYPELDFKKFLFFVFLLGNILTIIRFAATYEGKMKNTHLQSYFGSMLVCLLGTLVCAYYSRKYSPLNEPPMQGILASWSAFSNLQWGMKILIDFAIELDFKKNTDFYFASLQSYTFIDQYLKNNQQTIGGGTQESLSQILQRNKIIQKSFSKLELTKLRNKAKQGSLSLQDVKKIDRVLSDFCEENIWKEWKNTKSYLYLKNEFMSNSNINEKLELFKIEIL